MKRKISIAILFLITIIWGSAFVFQDLASEHVSSFTFNFLRFFIGSMVLTPVAVISAKRDQKNKNEKMNIKQLIIASVVCGAFLSLASVLQQFGIAYSSVGKAGFITATYIVIVPLLYLFVRRRYTINVYLAVVIALAGLYLLCVKGTFNFEIGDLLLLGCAISFAFQIVFVEYFSKRVNNICLSLGQSLVSCLVCVIPCFVIEKPTLASVQQGILPILYVAVFSTCIAYTLQIVAQKNVNSTLASLIMSLESVFSVIFAAIILKQYLSTQELIACIIMFSSIILAQLPEKWFLFKKKPDCKKLEENQ